MSALQCNGRNTGKVKHHLFIVLRKGNDPFSLIFSVNNLKNADDFIGMMFQGNRQHRPGGIAGFFVEFLAEMIGEGGVDGVNVGQIQWFSGGSDIAGNTFLIDGHVKGGID